MITKGELNNAQVLANKIIEWFHDNRVFLYPEKCKEIRISFACTPQEFDAITIDGKELEVVKSAKLLGLTISDNLSWNAHVNEVVKKSSKKLYFLVQLKRAQLLLSDLVLFYKSCSRILSGASFLQRRAAILEK